MTPQPRNNLIVISGPSGVGKSTIIRRVLESPELKNALRFSISATTRAPRPGERDGADYYFLSNEQFDAHVENDGFLEWAKVHDSRYGTLRSEIGKAAAEDKDLLLELDVQGGASIKRSFPDALLIFLSAPDSSLRTRLEKRPSALSEEKLRHEINLRLNNAQAEMQQADYYDHIVLNENLDETVQKVVSIIRLRRNAR